MGSAQPYSLYGGSIFELVVPNQLPPIPVSAMAYPVKDQSKV